VDGVIEGLKVHGPSRSRRGASDPAASESVLEFCRRNPRFPAPPRGEPRTAEERLDTGLRAMSWVDFLTSGLPRPDRSGRRPFAGNLKICLLPSDLYGVRDEVASAASGRSRRRRSPGRTPV